jgi:autotransporter-associated beta strand protein
MLIPSSRVQSALRVGLALCLLTVVSAPVFGQTVYTWTTTAAEPRNWYLGAPTPQNNNPATDPNGNWPNNNGLGATDAAQGKQPQSNLNTVVVFTDAFDASSNYQALNNWATGNFQLNQLTLAASVGNGDLRITGNPLEFVNNSTAAAPQISKTGSQTFTIQNNLVLTGNMSLTGAGTGSLNLGVSDGSVIQTISGAGSLTINRNGGNNVMYGNNTYTGGTVWLGGTANPSLAIGSPTAFGTGTFVITGAGNHITRLVQTTPGILNNGGSNAVTLANAVSLRADLTISVGSLATSSITWSGPVSLFNTSRTITQNETGAGKFVAFNGAIQDSIPGLTLPAGQTAEPAVGTGSLTKAGAGPLRLGGVNTYHGNTAISAGSLVLTGTGSFANSPLISISSGATLDVTGVTGGANFSSGAFALAVGQTLSGAGAVSGASNVRNGSTISPGTNGTVGTLGISGNTALDGILLEDVSNATADKLAVTGNLQLTSNSALNLPGSNVYDSTTVLQIATYSGTLSGTFGTANVPNGYGLFYGTFAGLPNAIVLAPVPEPGTLLLTSAAVVVGVIRWRRRRVTAAVTSSPSA